MRTYFEAHGIDVRWLVLEPGEETGASTPCASTHDADRSGRCRVMAALGLPLNHPACRSDLAGPALADAVRHRDGRRRVPLATGIGSARFFDDLTAAEIRAAESFLQMQRTVHA
ncbi:hypothetical protein [Streptomyces sp. NPDC087297]|uniref:hypothetical protein n=1 Tax=Streptomyces sp. NPDC087297 TaxID=3365778 RepID=UPI003819F775